MKKEVKLIMNDKTINLTDFDNFMYLDYVENDVQINTNTTEINGVDGVLTGASTFAPFELELRFMFSGVDIHDYHLFKHKLRQIIYQREPYYVWHSDMPGKKYAVLPNATEIEDLYSRNGEITMTFSVFKGYSESLFPTDRLDLMSEYWDFSNSLIVDENIKYNHNKNNFEIYNGSDDVITPIQRHYMKTEINIDAPNGFILKNNTNGTEFEYTKAIKSKDNLVLNGAHPFLNGKNCGIDTNWEFLTLDPGMNKFEIIGDGAQVKNITFSFNFIYR